jgi:hypothetical protein
MSQTFKYSYLLFQLRLSYFEIKILRCLSVIYYQYIKVNLDDYISPKKLLIEG